MRTIERERESWREEKSVQWCARGRAQGRRCDQNCTYNQGHSQEAKTPRVSCKTWSNTEPQPLCSTHKIKQQVNENKASKQAEMTSGKCCNKKEDKQKEQKQADEEGRKRETHTQTQRPSFLLLLPPSNSTEKNPPAKKKQQKKQRVATMTIQKQVQKKHAWKNVHEFPELLRQATKLHHHLLNPYHTWASTALASFQKIPKIRFRHEKYSHYIKRKLLKSSCLQKWLQPICYNEARGVWRWRRWRASSALPLSLSLSLSLSSSSSLLLFLWFTIFRVFPIFLLRKFGAWNL